MKEQRRPATHGETASYKPNRQLDLYSILKRLRDDCDDYPGRPERSESGHHPRGGHKGQARLA